MSGGEGRACLVTGASRGIGAATAKLLAAHGYAVAVNYHNAADAAHAVVEAIEAGGGHALAIRADVAREDEVARLFEEAEAELGAIRGLVSNAGAVGPFGRLADAEPATMRSIVDLNLTASLLCARQAVRRMSTRHGGQGGVIVNVSSTAATIGSPGECVWYAASKAGVDGMTKGLAVEVAGEGIRVVAVAPGLTDTEIHAASGMPDRAKRLAPNVPLGRAAQPEEVAEAVLWLMSPAASYVTGEVLRIGGGR